MRADKGTKRDGGGRHYRHLGMAGCSLLFVLGGRSTALSMQMLHLPAKIHAPASPPRHAAPPKQAPQPRQTPPVRQAPQPRQGPQFKPAEQHKPVPQPVTTERPKPAPRPGPFDRSKPLPQPVTTERPKPGPRTYSNGGILKTDPSHKPVGYSNPRTGVEAKGFDPKTGRPAQLTHTVQGRQTTVQRAGDARLIRTTRTVPGGIEHVVSYGHSGGYVQQPIAGRRGYVQRTIVNADGQSRAAVYRSYTYGHTVIYSPAPSVVFAPAYYGWLMTPWPQPINYASNWGWNAQPWYAYYRSGFTPYQTYAGPDQWLTDYVISANLQQAYAEQVASGDGVPTGPVPQITDEDKAVMAQDIRDELARQQQEAAVAATAPVDDRVVDNPPAPAPQITAVPEALKDHLFTVYAAPLQVHTDAEGTCNLSMGDMLFRTGDTANADDTVDVVVRAGHGDASHADLCAPQAHAQVQLADLQEMYNHKKELLAEGEQKQSEIVGKKHGLPKGPKPQATQLAQNKIDPDTQAAVDALKKQIQEADDAEKEVSVVTATGSGS